MDEGTALLQWNSYRFLTENIFTKLYEDNLFSDVTLVCEDNFKVIAHRVVLSACSDFFRKILTENQQTNLVIYLHDTKGEDLSLLKRFMYLGFAEVDMNKSKSFQDLAKRFLNKFEEKRETDFVDGNEVIGTVAETPIESLGKYSTTTKPLSKALRKKEPIIINNTTLNKKDTPKVTLDLPCHICNLMFHRRTKLKCHIRTEHPNVEAKICEPKNYPCSEPFCESILKNIECLRHHMQTVHQADRTRYICDECPYSCLFSGSLKDHKLKHSGSKGHISCEQCGYTTNKLKSLKGHMESKHNSAEYTCTKCDKKLRTKRILKFHDRKVHQGIRYNCESCTYKASTQRNLKIHMLRVHANFRISCEFCDYKDVEESRMNLHVVKKHGRDNLSSE